MRTSWVEIALLIVLLAIVITVAIYLGDGVTTGLE